MTVELVITVHDQDLLIGCESSGRYAAFPHTYLFVGRRPVDRVPADVNLIVARDHPSNVEHLQSFYDFTGWQIIATHDLVDADHLICVQYDMEIADPAIAEKCTELLTAAPGMVAFSAGYYSAGSWMLAVPNFEKTYRRGMAAVGVDVDDWPPFDAWPCTQGTAWRRDEFTAFMRWFEPLFDVWAAEMWAGHLAERTVKAWSMVTEPERYLLGAIVHQVADCHGTGAWMRGDYATYEQRNAVFRYQSS